MITRKDVARRAKVSETVVSRVLNDRGYVSKEKRQEVYKAAKALKYHPNPVARGLKTKRTYQLLYYVNDLNNSFYLELYKGMMDHAQKRRYTVVLSGRLDNTHIRNLMFDGVILPYASLYNEYRKASIEVPVIAANYGEHAPQGLRCVDVDAGKAIRMMVQHLRTHNHRTIAYASGQEPPTATRARTYRELMEPVLDRVDDYILGGPAPTENNDANDYAIGRTAAMAFVSRQLKATAVVCFNDDIAIGLIGGLAEFGVKVPEDVSVIGLADQPESRYANPPLTTIRLPMREQGSECARLLIDALEEKKTIDKSLPMVLVERKTVSHLPKPE